jgi:peptide/nickel transport system permease protein
MLAYIARRLWQMIPTMLGVMLLVFLLFNWVAGDPAYILAGKISNPEQIANIRRQLGIDEPVYIQLWIFLKQVVSFDFGASWSTGESVSRILATRLGPSLTLLIPLIILETVIAVALALAVAHVRGSLTDRAVMIVCTVGMSISILVYIIVFQYGFAYKLGLFPVQGWGEGFGENLFRYAALPILILLAVGIAPNLRLFRTFVLDEINQDYVRRRLLEMGAAEVVLAVFADKATGKKKVSGADHVGLSVPDKFVIGFGMDIQGYWRNLPEIRAVKS